MAMAKSSCNKTTVCWLPWMLKQVKKVWDVQNTDPKVGATNTNAAHVIKDKVLTGCSGAEFGVRCFIAAYNIKDGSLA